MRLVFAGTPAVAVPSLNRLAASGHDVTGVLTRVDAPVGRKRVLQASPVADAATELGLPVHKTNRLDEAAGAFVADQAPDLGVIVAYGGFVREPLLSLPRLGWINLHFSLLPAWRGAAPVQHSLIAGDAVTGASVFQLVAAMDAGDVFATREFVPAQDATSGSVLHDLSLVGAELLAGVVDALGAGTAIGQPQTGEPTFAPKLTAEDGRVRWAEPAARVLARIHGTTPEPGAHTRIDGARLKLLEAFTPDVGRSSALALRPGQFALDGGQLYVGTGTEAIGLRRVQPDGKSAMDAAAWWRGLRTDILEAELWSPDLND